MKKIENKLKVLILDSKHTPIIAKNIEKHIDNVEILLDNNCYNPLDFIKVIQEKKPDYIIFDHWYYNKDLKKYIPLGDKFLNTLYDIFAEDTIVIKRFLWIFKIKEEKQKKVSNFYSKFISINQQWNKIREYSSAYNNFTMHGFIKDRSISKIIERIRILENRKINK